VKYLYWNFVNDSLVSAFDVTVSADVDALQNAIWMAQGQMTASTTNRFLNEAAVITDFTGYDVSVMNLWTDYNAPYEIGCGDRQSQLIINAAPVPEPASLVLMGVGLIAIGIGKRFRK